MYPARRGTTRIRWDVFPSVYFLRFPERNPGLPIVQTHEIIRHIKYIVFVFESFIDFLI
jgi:hypothetical protein